MPLADQDGQAAGVQQGRSKKRALNGLPAGWPLPTGLGLAFFYLFIYFFFNRVTDGKAFFVHFSDSSDFSISDLKSLDTGVGLLSKHSIRLVIVDTHDLTTRIRANI